MTFISFAAAQSAANDLSRRRGMEAASRLFQGMLGSVGPRPKGLLLLLLSCDRNVGKVVISREMGLNNYKHPCWAQISLIYFFLNFGTQERSAAQISDPVWAIIKSLFGTTATLEGMPGQHVWPTWPTCLAYVCSRKEIIFLLPEEIDTTPLVKINLKKTGSTGPVGSGHLTRKKC